jgi:L-asparaginase
LGNVAQITILTSGGTIASTGGADGAKAASRSGDDLLRLVRPNPGTVVTVRDVLRVNSYDMTPALMQELRDAAHRALDDGADGVVITHGTDTMEESAMVLDLCHHDPRPVVLTGSQRSFDEPDGDAAGNLGDAVTVAAAPAARDRGVLVAFAGRVLAARGTRKVHTADLDAFADPDAAPLGTVDGATVDLVPRTGRPPFLLPADAAFDRARVDVVSVYPGADDALIDAAVAAGATGVVLEGTGYGNANRTLVAAVARCTAAGIAVVLSTRVPAGPVRGVYGGGGGGVDLIAAGAVPATGMRAGQVRMLLAGLLSSGASLEDVRTALGAPDPSAGPAGH